MRLPTLGKAQCLSRRYTERTTATIGVASRFLVGELSRITEVDRVLRKIKQRTPERFPSRLKRQDLVEKSAQVVDFSESDSTFAKARLEVLLRALLSMKTETIVIRSLPRPIFTQHRCEIAFGLSDPLLSQRLHTTLPRCRGCPGRKCRPCATSRRLSSGF